MAKCSMCGKGGLFTKLPYGDKCAECHIKDLEQKINDTQRKFEEAEALITPEMREVSAIKKKIQELSNDKQALVMTNSKLQDDINNAEKRLVELNKEIIVAQETIELETFSLYQPRYAFVSSDEYKANLDKVREEQKAMIKNGTAATCSSTWTVNGSVAEGKKQTADNIKLFLRSFNNECDVAVSGAKFNNYEKCEQRIEKSYETINKLGRISNISLSRRYFELKLSELRLAYEYARKKQEEKEEQAEIRRREREQAKLEKEIAEARKAAEKEKQHYEQALSKLNAQLLDCKDANKKQELEEKRAEMLENIGDIQAKLEDIDYRQANQRAGYVYIISNLGAFGENVYKIGMTRRLNPMDRVDELGDASVPFEFDVHAMIFSADAPALEAALHRAFENKRINKINRRREYFKVTLDEIKAVVRANHDKTVEFVETYTAEQYRESLLMK